MDPKSVYHSTMMQRPQEEDDERLRRERMNGTSHPPQPYHVQSPTQSEFHQPLHSTNGAHPRSAYNTTSKPYPAPADNAPTPMTAASHVAVPPPPHSPQRSSGPSVYSSDYQDPARDKPTSNYYDPTSDSSERKPAEPTATWQKGSSSTSQVYFVFSIIRASFVSHEQCGPSANNIV